MRQALEPSVKQWIEMQIQQTGGSQGTLPGRSLADNEIGRPDFYEKGAPGRIPFSPPASDLVTAIGRFNLPADGEVRDIYVTQESSASCTQGTVASYKATIEYRFNDYYEFDAGDATFNGPDAWGRNLNFCGWAAPFVSSIALQERLTGSVIVTDKLNCDPPTQPSDPTNILIVQPVDPNDMVGPAGYGDNHWVANDFTMGYTIRFENDPTQATAPAQRVVIEQTLDSDLDLRTFRLGSFGFGSHYFAVPANRSSFQARLDVREDLGLYVDVTAGIDVVNGRAFWIFQSIDPATGAPPTDPLAGFLPPDINEGEGQGFVTYRIKPKTTAVTGTRIDALASIIFDTNEAIETPPIFNTIDAGRPLATLDALPPETEGVDITLTWRGQDDPGGSGLHGVNLYVSTDGSPFVLARSGTTQTTTLFTGSSGRTYGFFVQAEDNAGNRETLQTSAEATTLVFVPGAPTSVLLTADPAMVPADGSSTSTIQATIRDGRGDGLPGQQVAFTATLGTLSSPVVTTNASGVVTVTLQASAVPGVATVTASAGDVNGSVTVTFDPSGPAAVNIAAARTTDSVRIGWTHLPVNTTYQIWRSDDPYFSPSDGGSSMIATLAPPVIDDTIWFTDTGVLLDGNSYYYTIVAGNAGGQQSTPSNHVGKFARRVAPGMNLVSLPLVPSSTAIQDVVGAQLTGASSELYADRIWTWDPANQDYDYAWLISGIGPGYDGLWWDGDPWGPSAMVLEPGMGFWVQNRQTFTQTLAFVGAVPEAADHAVTIVEGMQLIGSSYPVSETLYAATFIEDGAHGTASELYADRVWYWDEQLQDYDYAWLIDGAGPPYDGKWWDGDPWGETTITLKPGVGYWYQRRGVGPFVWTNPNPAPQ
jgi:hypothetical protein